MRELKSVGSAAPNSYRIFRKKQKHMSQKDRRDGKQRDNNKNKDQNTTLFEDVLNIGTYRNRKKNNEAFGYEQLDTTLKQIMRTTGRKLDNPDADTADHGIEKKIASADATKIYDGIRLKEMLKKRIIL